MMKNKIKYTLGFLLLVGTLSCASKDQSTEQTEQTEQSPNKLAKLAKLKAERTKLDQKIQSMEEEMKVKREKPLMPVSVKKVNPQEFIHEIEVHGKIEANKNILVPAESSGVLERIYVKEGDVVSKGQIMAQVDNKILLSQINEVKGNLSLARNIFERTERLYKQEIGSEVDYLQAKNKKEALESNLATLNAQLSKTKVLAPFSGRVDKVVPKEGEAVSAGMGIIRVVHVSELKIIVDLSEEYITSIHKGQDVKVQFPTINKTMNLKVSAVSSVIDPNIRTFAVDIALPSNDDFYPNMYSIVTIKDYVNNNAIVVPEMNITSYRGKDFIYILDKDSANNTIAKFVEIKTGKTYNGNTEILEGISVGDEYISEGYSQLSDGREVLVK